MTGKSSSVLFVTANVGSIFEEPSRMIKVWAEEFLSTISRLDPKFIALHCQEVGGKNYEKSMQYVDSFVKLLLASNELRLFDRVRIYLDEDYTSAENFTALGNFYFIHESLTDVLQYDFMSRSFVEVKDVKVFAKDVEAESTKEKSKFPLEFFPECKWSRKGFLRTRWSINGSIFDLVNIHLFHDASNFVAAESFPSEYSETRRQALVYTLDRFNTDEHLTVPVFIFGDFNFRTDTKGVVNRLSEGLQRTLTEEGSNESTLDFSDGDDKVLRLGKKTFSHLRHQDIFSGSEAEWLRSYDKELEFFRDQLFEFAISFQPSYPFEEGETGAKKYMQTRCPAWCDRVLLTKDALSLVKDESDPASVEYGLIGPTTCMGDHKPVYLKIELNANVVENRDVRSTDVCEGGDFPFVKRVNSASSVETRTKRHDWQTARCNSDVSWNPAAAARGAPPVSNMRRSLLHGSSRIRLVTPGESLQTSLPRLTSHHSSSDEEWFEVIDGEDEVIEISSEEADDKTKEIHPPDDDAKEKRISIVKSVKGEEAIVDDDVEKASTSRNFLVLKTQSLLANVHRRRRHKKEDDAVSWETIDLSDPSAKPNEKEKSRRARDCCTIL